MEPFTVTQLDTGETWTRNSKKGAFGLADNIARLRKAVAIVTLTETGYEEYRAEPEVEEIDEVERAVVISESYDQAGGL